MSLNTEKGRRSVPVYIVQFGTHPSHQVQRPYQRWVYLVDTYAYIHLKRMTLHTYLKVCVKFLNRMLTQTISFLRVDRLPLMTITKCTHQQSDATCLTIYYPVTRYPSPAVPPRLVADVPPDSSVRPEVGYPLRLSCPIEGAAPVRWLKDRRPITERDGVLFDGRLGLIVLR